jgi:hypothetical protein
MKVVVDAGHPLHSRFAKTVLRWRALPQLRSAHQMRIPPIVPIKSKSSMEGDRERHGPFRARPFQAVGQRAPAPGSAYRKPTDVMMPRAKFITNISHVLPTDG